MKRTLTIAGMALVCATADLQLAGQSQFREIATLNAVGAYVTFSPDGSTLATGARAPASPDKPADVILWDVATGKPRVTIAAHDVGVGALAYSADGHVLVTGGFDNLVKLWDATSGSPIKTLSGHNDWVRKITFSPDGRTLATGQGGNPTVLAQDNHIILWDVASGTRRTTLRIDGFQDVDVYGLIFTPDGKELIVVHSYSLSGEVSGRVIAFDLETERMRPMYSDPSGALIAGALSPDGSALVTGGFTRMARLAKLPSGVPVVTLPPFTNWVFTLAFSPDGRMVAVGTGNSRGALLPGQIWLFNAASGEPIGDSSTPKAAVLRRSLSLPTAAGLPRVFSPQRHASGRLSDLLTSNPLLDRLRRDSTDWEPQWT